MPTIACPKPKFTKEQLDKFFKNPEIVALEILFVVLTLFNVFVLYRILTTVCPFPISVTWFQLVTGFFLALIFGETSRQFPKFAIFPTFTFDWKLYKSLALSSLFFLAMITFANIILADLPTVASFPVVVSLAVCLHHVSRFIGCGQVYLPIRWISLGIMLLGFLLGLVDKSVMGIHLFPLALLYAFTSAIYRAWCLEKSMHVVQGQGNTLHNQQVVLGILVLPFLALLFGEVHIFRHMPCNFLHLFTWQCWGCLVTAGTIPFLKNVVANRLIRKTGQAPWRALEVASMVFVFIFGAAFFDHFTFVGLLSFALVLSGRILGMLDALSKDPDERVRAVKYEVQDSADSHRYDPTGVSNSFQNGDDDEGDNGAASDKEGDVELGDKKLIEEGVHNAERPLLSTR